MRYLIACMAFLVGCGPSDATWEKVRIELVNIHEKDQRYRAQMDSVGRKLGWDSEAVRSLWLKQHALDSENLVSVDRILTQCGYPPQSKVGDLVDIPFEVIRRADDSTLSTYYEVIVGASREGGLNNREVAQYQDNVLMIQRFPQEYGTQISVEFVEDASTGKSYDSVFLWPIRNPESVDARRHSMGLDSIANHLRRLGIDSAKGYVIRKSS
jgi:hypothetical protein